MRKINIGHITIAGEDYPAIVNVRLIMQLQKQGIEIDQLFDSDRVEWEKILKFLVCMINEGYRLINSDQKVTEDEIAEMLTIAEIKNITTQLSILFGNSGRTVEAEPPKN